MTELLDRAEDPARMIRMIIMEMEETLVEVRATAARSIADIKEMRRACTRLDDLQDNWTEKAELALEKDREDLARAALNEKQKAAEMADGLRAEMAQIEQVLRGYETDIARLQAKLAEARSRQAAIASRLESAVTRARARELLHGSRTEDAFARFEILERRADLAEGYADALGADRAEEPGRRNCRAEGRRKGRCGAGSAQGRAGGEELMKEQGNVRDQSLFAEPPDKKLAGVCSTLGDVFNLDPTFIRIGFVAAAILISWEMALIAYIAAGIYLHIQKKRSLSGIGERKSDFERMAEVGRGRTSVHALRTELDATDRRMMAIDHHLNSQKNHELAREIEALREEK